MKSMKSIKLSLVAIAVCGMANADEVVDLGEMSVTATKTEQATSESPANVSIVSNKRFEQKNVSRVTDALQAIPSLNMSGSSFNGQMSQGVGASTFTLRGMD
ncbi:MAG: TonB-dependent receptor plug domain-containing protein, partial [Arcobacteraceae bacterium]|nr:TonB-dependent receptor plug domain-containing protein [Arcobacteraceae bacterium]